MTLGVVAFPYLSPAPLTFTPGEGWTYEAVGSEGSWLRPRAKEQMEVAQAAFDKKDYSLAMKAARHTVKQWPLSDYAPKAQYLVGRCYEARNYDEKAFSEYQKLLSKYPKYVDCEEVLKRQYEIANRFLGGQWFRLWGYIPVFPSMEKTADMYEKLIKNGLYSDVAAQAQISIGTAQEKRSEYGLAVKAYERAADRYHDSKKIAADALYKAGLAYNKQARTAEYDQNAAAQAIASFADFMALYPDDSRVAEAKKIIETLRTEQSRGSFQVAKFYEKSHRWEGALVYYNEAIIKDPNSTFAVEAKKRIETIKARTGEKAAVKTSEKAADDGKTVKN